MRGFDLSTAIQPHQVQPDRRCPGVSPSRSTSDTQVKYRSHHSQRFRMKVWTPFPLEIHRASISFAGNERIWIMMEVGDPRGMT